MRSLINHLQAQCKLYNLEANRFKKQCKDLEDELVKVKAKQETFLSNGFLPQTSVNTSEPTSAGSINITNQEPSPPIKDEPNNPFASITTVKMEMEIKDEPNKGVGEMINCRTEKIDMEFLE